MTRIYSLLPLLFLLQACNSPLAARPDMNPDELQQLYSDSIQAYRDGDMQQAESGLESLLQHKPGNANAWFRLGNVYARSGRYQQAVMTYRKALSIEPSLFKARHNLAIAHLRLASLSFADLQQQTSDSDPLKQHAAQRQAGHVIEAVE